MGNRIPKFETHIRPMIRRLDRDRMIGRFDLWSYEDVTRPDHLGDIVDRISRPSASENPHGEMPPKEFGGPWPVEWIDVFNRWVDAGCPRLEQVSSGAEFTIVPITAEVSSLVAKGESEGFGYSIWFEREFDSGDPTRFSLFREAPETPPPFGSKEFDVSIDFKDEPARPVFVNGQIVPRGNQSSERV